MEREREQWSVSFPLSNENVDVPVRAFGIRAVSRIPASFRLLRLRLCRADPLSQNEQHRVCCLPCAYDSVAALRNQ